MSQAPKVALQDYADAEAHKGHEGRGEEGQPDDICATVGRFSLGRAPDSMGQPREGRAEASEKRARSADWGAPPLSSGRVRPPNIRLCTPRGVGSTHVLWRSQISQSAWVRPMGLGAQTPDSAATRCAGGNSTSCRDGAAFARRMRFGPQHVASSHQQAPAPIARNAWAPPPPLRTSDVFPQINPLQMPPRAAPPPTHTSLARPWWKPGV